MENIEPRNFPHVGLTPPTEPNMWTAGMMRHLIGALEGAPVDITTNNQRGLTIERIRLVRVYATATNRGYTLTFARIRSSRTGAEVPVPLHKIGNTITAHQDGVRQKALCSYEEEQAAAIRVAQRVFPDMAGPGAWSATPYGHGVGIAYMPHNAADRVCRQLRLPIPHA
ncbi:hypothetical protein [Salinispora vitiensis]|uniref:hypothetical protein n=1 Tax=Salinispora vitiensis TaxID=999544 RepID=UPI00037B2ACE|nr:hypothetical protein [Salinispora vitiensis]